jgi:hypothetical protein
MEILGAKEYFQINGNTRCQRKPIFKENIIIIILLDDKKKI